MMTEEKATRIIHDQLKRSERTGRRFTHILVHPDYHLIVSPIAAKYGIYLVIDSAAPLDKFMFRHDPNTPPFIVL